jgi:hypothetical protein
MHCSESVQNSEGAGGGSEKWRRGMGGRSMPAPGDSRVNRRLQLFHGEVERLEREPSVALGRALHLA